MHYAASIREETAAFSAAANFWHEEMCEDAAAPSPAAQARFAAGMKNLVRVPQRLLLQ